MQHDAWFFIGIFVFIFIVWIAVGGPLHPIAFSGPTLAPPQELGGGTYLQFPRAPGVGSGALALPSSGGIQSLSGSSGTGAVSGGEVPPPMYGIPFGTPSPYRNAVSVSTYVYNASSTNEYLEIYVSQNAGMPVDITGWIIGSGASGNIVTIPEGTAVPISGVVNAAEHIVLRPGDRAIIATAKSPVGASFRENKCIGYFGSFQQFSPQLPQNCPAPQSELSSFYPGITYIHDPDCVDYVNTIPRCQVPFPPRGKVNMTCEVFLENYLNYNGCVAAHKGDADFNGTTWHVFLGHVNDKNQVTPLWRARHEFIKVFDAQVKTVAQFSY